MEYKFKKGDEVEIISLNHTIDNYGGDSVVSPIGTVSVITWIEDNEVELSEDNYSYHVKDLKLIKKGNVIKDIDVCDQGVKPDNVNSPTHYASQSIECIVAMEAMLSKEEFIGYLRGKLIEMKFKTTCEGKV